MCSILAICSCTKVNVNLEFVRKRFNGISPTTPKPLELGKPARQSHVSTEIDPNLGQRRITHFTTFDMIKGAVKICWISDVSFNSFDIQLVGRSRAALIPDQQQPLVLALLERLMFS